MVGTVLRGHPPAGRAVGPVLRCEGARRGAVGTDARGHSTRGADGQDRPAWGLTRGGRWCHVRAVSEPVDDSPLGGAEVSEVLRYWLAALRFEEALLSRPRAHRPNRRQTVDLADPRGGQPYFKVRADEEGAGFLLRDGGELLLDLDAERTAFFVRWLRLAYMRERAPFPGWDGDASAVVAAWPVVYFPRTEELAGLFRMRASVSWYRADGKRFEPPPYRARRSGALPPPPTQLRLVPTTEEEGLLPFSLDTQLLVQTLGITDEEVADLEATLKGAEDPSPAEVVATVCALLESREGWQAGPASPGEADPEALFARAVAAIEGRLVEGRGTPTVYPVGLVHDGDQVFATRHLQRELAHLLERRVGAPPWGQKTPLWGYLAGKAPRAGWRPMRGLRAPRPITVEQRAVAERFLASPLTAAQGPPGTGKTELLLNLAAAAVVERIDELADGGSMPRDLLLVASTNNRAVDHVLEPLARGLSGPPLGLRVGNLQVLSTVTVDLLVAVMQWLDGRPDRGEAAARDDLRAALATFRELRSTVHTADGPRIAAREHARRRATLDERIAAREAALARVRDAEGEPPPAALRQALDKRLRALAAHLDRMRKAIERRGPDLLTRVMTIWQQTRNQVQKPLVKALGEVELPLELPLPPEVPAGAEEQAHIDAWSAGIDASDAALDAVRQALDARADAAEHRAALLRLRDERALLPEAGPAPPEGADAEAQFALFEAALAVRAAWAEAHRGELRAALTTAVEAVSERRTLRRLADDDPGAVDWLAKLFPVWGSTLLSLGNVLPAQPVTGLRLVLDEAGQCHPAYAVSGLMRAEQALLIGDVHQLEPVIQLRPEDEGRVRAAAGIRLPKARLGPYRVMEGSGNSAQSLADRAVGDRPTLRAHFRCQAPIIALSDALCGYGLSVRTPPPVDPAPLPGPVLLTPVRGEQLRVRGSWHNPAELERVMAILRGLQMRAVPWGDVAVITPYVGQLEALRDAVRRVRIPVEHVGGALDEPDLFGDTGLALGTVHRFQGGERRVVIFTTVVTRGRSLGFLNGRVNLLNVAVSRAREHLVVVGDPETLRGGAYSKLLVERAAPFLLDP